MSNYSGSSKLAWFDAYLAALGLPLDVAGRSLCAGLYLGRGDEAAIAALGIDPIVLASVAKRYRNARIWQDASVHYPRDDNELRKMVAVGWGLYVRHLCARTETWLLSPRRVTSWEAKGLMREIIIQRRPRSLQSKLKSKEKRSATFQMFEAELRAFLPERERVRALPLYAPF